MNYRIDITLGMLIVNLIICYHEIICYIHTTHILVKINQSISTEYLDLKDDCNPLLVLWELYQV